MHRTTLFTAFVAAVLLASCVPAASQGTAQSSSSSVSIAIGSEASSDDTVATSTGVTVSERILSGGMLELGSAQARLAMLLFTNHSCGYCQDFHRTLLPRLLNDFVVNGKLRIDIVPFAMDKYPASNTTASLMLCAAEQGHGQVINDLLFSQSDSKTVKKKMTATGLDMADLDGCIHGQRMQAILNHLAEFAASKNIALAPSYILAATTYTGLPEYADLRGQINAELH